MIPILWLIFVALLVYMGFLLKTLRKEKKKSRQKKPALIKITCCNCGGHLKAPVGAAGKRGKCSYCRTIFEIPGEKKCVHCLKRIDKNAIVCEHCGSNLRGYDPKQDFVPLSILAILLFAVIILLVKITGDVSGEGFFWFIIFLFVALGLVWIIKSRGGQGRVQVVKKENQSEHFVGSNLLNCPDCNKHVSGGAESCPHCGLKLFGKETQAKKTQGVIHFNCPTCKTRLKAGESNLGRIGRCPGCGGLYKTTEAIGCLASIWALISLICLGKWIIDGLRYIFGTHSSREK